MQKWVSEAAIDQACKVEKRRDETRELESDPSQAP